MRPMASFRKCTKAFGVPAVNRPERKLQEMIDE